ncbi:hypothetical protein CR513_43735, partial [Mucuna pruriens]
MILPLLSNVDSIAHMISSITKISTPSQPNSIWILELKAFNHISYPLNTILQQLCQNFRYISHSKNLVCGCFILINNTSFLSSQHSYYSTSFDLLHMDIWSPIIISPIQGHCDKY